MVAHSSATLEVETESAMDAIDEIRLRTWARKNYVPADERDQTWHPIVLEEMERKDREEGC